jgi:hypothetical protein
MLRRMYLLLKIISSKDIFQQGVSKAGTVILRVMAEVGRPSFCGVISRIDMTQFTLYRGFESQVPLPPIPDPDAPSFILNRPPTRSKSGDEKQIEGSRPRSPLRLLSTCFPRVSIGVQIWL